MYFAQFIRTTVYFIIAHLFNIEHLGLHTSQ